MDFSTVPIHEGQAMFPIRVSIQIDFRDRSCTIGRPNHPTRMYTNLRTSTFGDLCTHVRDGSLRFLYRNMMAEEYLSRHREYVLVPIVDMDYSSPVLVSYMPPTVIDHDGIWFEALSCNGPTLYDVEYTLLPWLGHARRAL